jgi:hypothetical protein
MSTQDRVVARFRQTAVQGSLSWHKAAEADEATGDAYRKLVSLKLEIDRFEEIPKDLMPLYQSINKAMGALGKARDETNTVRELVKRAARGYRSAARLDDLERPAQDVVNMCRDLYCLVGRIEERAKTLKAVHPEVAATVLKQVQDLDRLARRLSMDVDEGLGID